jgi:O-Antigen ligase
MILNSKIKNSFVYLQIILFIAIINSDYIYGIFSSKNIYLNNLRNILFLILLILIIIKLFTTKNKLIIVNKIMFYFFVFLVYIIVSWGWITPATEYGGQKLQEVLASIILAFMPVLLLHDYIEVKKYYKCLLAMNLIILTMTVFVNDFSSYSMDTRLTMNGINPIWIARFVGEIIILLLFLIDKKRMLLFKYVLIGLLTIVILLTGSKGPLLSLIIAILLVNIMCLKKYIYLHDVLKGYFKLLLLLLSIFLFVKEVVLKLISLDYLKERFIIENSEASYGNYSRAHLFKMAFEYFVNHPLFGNGIGSFGYLYSGHDIREYPHNVILEVMSELGILGLILLLTPILLTIKKFYKYVKYDNGVYLKMTMTLFIYYFINSLVSGDLGFSNIGIFLYVGLLNHLYVLNLNKQKL